MVWSGAEVVGDPASFLDHLLRARAQHQSLGPIDELSSHLSALVIREIVFFFCFSSFSPLFSLSLSLLGVLIVQTEIQKENALVPVCDQVGGVSAFNDMEWLSLRRR